MSGSRVVAVRSQARLTRRRLVALLSVLSLILGSTALLSSASAASAAPASELTRLIVTMRTGVTADQTGAALDRAGAAPGRAVPVLRQRTVSVPSAQRDAVLARLKADRTVQAVEVEQTRKAAGEPNDPAYADQWALPKIGWDADAAAAADASATIAVLDTGVDGSNDDLSGRLVPGFSAFGTPATNDPAGHGTWLASIAAAAAGNGAGIAGVAGSGARVMPVQVLSADGTGQDSDVIAGLVHAADAGADVILMGFSNPTFSQALQDAVDYAWSKGAVLVAATGNAGSTSPTYPAGDAKVVGVSATDREDQLWSGSNSGEAVFLGAPGVGVLADAVGGGTTSVTGTSASAAVVAGAAALLKGNDAAASNGTIVGRLARTADAAGTPAQTGNGRVNVARALADTSSDAVVPVGTNGALDGGPFVGPYVVAAFGAELQGKSSDGNGQPTGNYISGNLKNWKATETIPLRVNLTGGPVTDQLITVEMPQQTNKAPAFLDLRGFTLSAGVTITQQPTVVDNGDSLTYSFKITMTGTAGEVAFTTSMRSGAHLNTGSSLSLTGTPSLGTLQISKPAAAPGAPDLEVRKSGPATVAPGSTVTYTLNYSNKSTAANGATLVALTDTLPAGFTYVSGSCSGCTVAGSDVSWNLGSLTVGASGSKTLQATVPANAGFNSTHTNTALILSAETDANSADNTSISTSTVSFNRAPVAVDDAYSAGEDTALSPTTGVLANDTDADGNALTATRVSGPSNGTLTLNSNGTFTYTPNANFNGSDSFTYKANDGTADSGVATVSITVNAVNDAPTAAAQSVTTAEDTAKSIALLAGDVDGNPLSYTVVSGPANGTLSGTGANLTYTPAANYSGVDSFDFKANDGTVDSNVATVSITVTAVNDAPVAAADSFSTAEDAALTVLTPGVLGNDSDVDSNGLTAVLVSGPANGTLTLNANGGFLYTPNASFSGSDSFTYKANDGTLNSNVATVSISVTSVNDAPVAAADSFSTDEDVALTVPAPGVLGNDSDVDGDGLTAVLVSGPTKGTLMLNADGGFLYTPNANYNGPDSFSYKANDGTVDSSTVTVSITVTAVNDAPTAAAQAVTTDEDTPKAITLRAGDVEGDALTYTVVDGPSHGTLSGTGANLIYTPNANYNGLDSFTFKANDGTVDSNVATVSISVTAVNDAPVADAQSVTTAEDTAKAITLAASDVDGNPLTYSVVSGPTHGTLSGTGADLTYTPNRDFNGADSFAFKANDGTVDSSTVTVSITVTAVNDAPTAAAQSVTTDEDTAKAITLLAGDVDSDALTYSVVSGPSHGTLSGTGGNLTYTPAADYSGLDSFTFKANDGTVDSNVATVSITVTPVNDAPVAAADAYSVNEDAVLSPATGVLANDTDADGNALTATRVSGPSNGRLTLNSDGTFTYTPNRDFHGRDSFTYEANDGTLNSNVATVSITVTPVNDAPVAEADSYSTDEDTALTVTAPGVLSNDSDVDGNGLTAVLVSGPASGTLTLNASGGFSYTPNADFNGSDSFSYKASDGTLDSDVVTVRISVAPGNDAPVASGQSVTTDEDIAKAITLAASDVDGNALTYSVVSGPAHGTLSGTGANLTYTPAGDYNGLDSFTFKANDGTVDSNVAIVSITVTAVNDAPTAAAQSVTTDEDTARAITLLAGDVESDALIYTVVSGPAHGTLSGTGANLTYTPAANFNGADSFTFKANDGTVDSGVATVSITVTPVNDAPVAVADSFSTDEDGALTVPARGVLVNDSDVDANTLTAVLVSGPVSGTLTLNPDGGFVYTPNADVNGPDSFSYKANDGTLDSGTVTVSITVNAVNDAPTAAAQSVTTDEDTAKAITLAGSDVDGNPLSYSVVSGPANGTLSGTGADLTYTPAANFNGLDSFAFKANDGTADSGVATVSITVNAVNDAPTAAAQSVTTAEDTAKAITLAAGDVDRNALTYTVVDGPANGTLSGTAPNLTYTPAANFNGADSFTFKANDGTVDSNVATVSITVTPVNDAPVAAADSFSTDEDRALTVPAPGVLGNDSDVDANTLTAVLVSGPVSGTLTLNADGGFLYTPNADVNGPDSFSYKANDSTLDSGTVTVSITVTAVNDAPVASGQSVTTAEDTAKAITLAASDVDRNPLTYTVVTGPAHGTLSGTAPNLTYTPGANYNGADSFTFKANDGTVDSNVATVSITVMPVNDAPAASAAPATQSGVQYSDPITTVRISAADVDSEPASLSAMVLNQAGSALGGLTLTPVGATTDKPRTWELTGRAMAPAGTYIVTVAVTDGVATTDVPVTITVTKENAVIEYTGDTLVSTGSTATNSTATLKMAASVTEQADGSLGSMLNTTQVKFTVSKSTGAEAGSCTAAIVTPTPYAGQGTAACTIPGLPADNYLLKVELLENGYYTAEVENAAATVVVAGTGFTTGGGWLTEPNLQTRSNLGFTVKYLKNGNIQGNSLYIYRKTVGANEVANPAGGSLPAGDYNWIIKSNAMTGLTQKCPAGKTVGCTATFTGKSTISAVNRLTGVSYSLGGNNQFQVDVTDNGEPGSSTATTPDTYALRVWDATGTYYQLGTATAQLALRGGNLQVRP